MTKKNQITFTTLSHNLPLSLTHNKLSSIVIITDSNVAHLYGKTLHLQLAQRIPEKQIKLISFPAGEENKTRKTKEEIENRMLSLGIGRDCTIVALGGGVTTDIAGYIAATYCRGVPLVLIPTTLLAMVDAAIGGKNGVNTSYGKNMIGTFYPAEEIIIDLETLKTLPQEERRNGMVEMLKHGVIDDATYFEELLKGRESLLTLSNKEVTKAVKRSQEIKEKIVAKDGREGGLRRILNFGHTVGHALEALSNYQLSHGEAVATGAIIEAKVAEMMGVLEKKDYQTILDAFSPYQKRSLAKAFSGEELFRKMQMDKKSSNSHPRIVLLERIGSPSFCSGNYCIPLKEELFLEAWKHYQKEQQKKKEREYAATK